MRRLRHRLGPTRARGELHTVQGFLFPSRRNGSMDPESLCAWRQESTDRCRAIQLMDRRLVSRHPPARRPPGVACMHMHANMACIDRWPQIWPNCGLHMSKPRSCILVISYRSRRWPSGRIGAGVSLSLSLCLLAPHATVRPSGSRSRSVSPLPCRAACACQLPSICART